MVAGKKVKTEMDVPLSEKQMRKLSTLLPIMDTEDAVRSVCPNLSPEQVSALIEQIEAALGETGPSAT